MPVARVQLPDGRVARLEVPDGTTPDQVTQFVQSQFQFKPDSPPPVSADTANMDPRDLRARNLLTSQDPEAIRERVRLASKAGPVDRFMMGPQDVVLGGAQLLAHLASPISEAPANAIDKYIAKREEEYRLGRLIRGDDPYGVDIARTGGSAVQQSALPLKPAATMVGRAAQGATIGAVGGATSIVQPGQDFAEEKTKQVGLGAVTGAVATPAFEVLMRGAAAAVNGIKSLATRAATPADIDAALASALSQQGVKFSDIAPEVQDALRKQVGGAVTRGSALNPEELRRFSDISAVGATPTRGMVSLDPVAVTQERNLAKMGANSNAPALQQLAQNEQANNAALIQRVNALGAADAPPQIATGARVINALKSADKTRQDAVGSLYTKAENVNALAGQVQPFTFDGAKFVDQATRALDAKGRGAFLPGEVRTVMQGLADRGPMTMEQVEQLRTILATAQRSAQDGNAKYAIGLVRDALENAEPSNMLGPLVKNAFSRARDAHAARMKLIDDVPALKAAIDGVEPDKFVQSFIIGNGEKASVADVNALKKAITSDPEAFDMVRRTIVGHLKARALNGAADEVGNFSQSAYNKALRDIGDQKLGAFFSPQEIESLRQVGRAAAYMQVQPKGSAVNNSGSGTFVGGMIDRAIELGSSATGLGQLAIGSLNSLRNSARQAQQNSLAQKSLQPFAPAPREIDPQLLRLLAPAGGVAGVAAAQQ